MNIYKALFILIFIWSSIYNISTLPHNFSSRRVFSAVNAIVLQIAGFILCAVYVFSKN